MFRSRLDAWLSLVLGVGLLVLTQPMVARADSLFSSLNGTWAGAGKIHLESGSTETLKCRAYYNSKEEGAGLGLAIRCASPSSKIELRATLAYDSGKISGNWEERQFNASGSVTGQASNRRVSLSIVGGGFSGSMTVTVNGSTQSVSISTNGIGLRSVNINLSRS